MAQLRLIGRENVVLDSICIPLDDSKIEMAAHNMMWLSDEQYEDLLVRKFTMGANREMLTLDIYL